MKERFDLRTLAILLVAIGLGLLWAGYNLGATGGVRNDTTVRALVWTVFATPFALLVGWLIARRWEWRLAVFCCFCLYFFTVFVAQRIETVVLSEAEAQASGHQLYFVLVLVFHGLAGIGLALWRALAPGEQPGTAEPLPGKMT
jgi:fucose 4-O-acetylase-like acetyltransferase